MAVHKKPAAKPKPKPAAKKDQKVAGGLTMPPKPKRKKKDIG